MTMDSFIDYDASTIIFNLIALPPESDERRDYYITLLKRRFYEWERKLISLRLVSEWKGIQREHLNPRDWTQAIFEVFWNEIIRECPSLNASSFSQTKISNIQGLLINSITNP